MNTSMIGGVVMITMLYMAFFAIFITKLTKYFVKKYGIAYDTALFFCVLGWFFLIGLFLFMIG
jgi:uncharacterized membrane protein